MNANISINGFNLEWIFGFIWIFVWLIFSLVFSFIVASIAQRKGYSFGGFLAFGVFAFVPALIVALMLPYRSRPVQDEPAYNAGDRSASPATPPSPKQCQYCASLNPPDVYKCQHCGAPLLLSE